MTELEKFIEKSNLLHEVVAVPDTEPYFTDGQPSGFFTLWIRAGSADQGSEKVAERFNTLRSYDKAVIYVSHFSFNIEKCEYKVTFYIKEYGFIEDYQI